MDQELAKAIDSGTRDKLWLSVDEILSHGPLDQLSHSAATGLALGYVQSGKTTTITALIAAAADRGYRIIIALLGTTNLLLDQNADRIEKAIGTSSRSDYKWVVKRNPKGVPMSKEIGEWVEKNRILLLPVLKHAGRIDNLAETLQRAGTSVLPTIIIDDEADQASLNTTPKGDSASKTNAAIARLRTQQPNHIYVQFTATPYAPLLLEPADDLRPEFVTFLHPGPGYTGGREFFIENAESVIRRIPAGDEQTPRTKPKVLPPSLLDALANFFSGSAMLLAHNLAKAPISMLVHATQSNEVQSTYEFLIKREIRRWAEGLNADDSWLPDRVSAEREKLVLAGAESMDDDSFREKFKFVVNEATVWLINSMSDLTRVDWNVTPIHVLVGGNKLDRGFTVEGLTVTYMNRPASVQVDTLEQRARAFGYRRELLPYCQFFAGSRTLKVLREIVHTEYDLRAMLRDHLDSGGSVDSWSRDVGLMLPSGTKPTRDSVIAAVGKFNARPNSWHVLRRPSKDPADIQHNANLVAAIGLPKAPLVDYGRKELRTLELPATDIVEQLLQKWRLGGSSPEWRHDEICDVLLRQEVASLPVTTILMTRSDGSPRIRKADELGFVNLFQGEDTKHVQGRGFYPGDRNIPMKSPDGDYPITLEVHFVAPRDDLDRACYTLAIRLGDRTVVRRIDSDN